MVARHGMWTAQGEGIGYEHPEELSTPDMPSTTSEACLTGQLGGEPTAGKRAPFYLPRRPSTRSRSLPSVPSSGGGLFCARP